MQINADANTPDLILIQLNQTQKQPFGAELFCIKILLKILAKVLEKNFCINFIK